MRKCWVLEAGRCWTKNHAVESDAARKTRCGVQVPELYQLFGYRRDDLTNDDCLRCFPQREPPWEQ